MEKRTGRKYDGITRTMGLARVMGVQPARQNGYLRKDQEEDDHTTEATRWLHEALRGTSSRVLLLSHNERHLKSSRRPNATAHVTAITSRARRIVTATLGLHRNRISQTERGPIAASVATRQRSRSQAVSPHSPPLPTSHTAYPATAHPENVKVSPLNPSVRKTDRGVDVRTPGTTSAVEDRRQG